MGGCSKGWVGWIGPKINCEIAVEGKLDGSGTGQNFLAKDHKNKSGIEMGGKRGD